MYDNDGETAWWNVESAIIIILTKSWELGLHALKGPINQAKFEYRRNTFCVRLKE